MSASATPSYNTLFDRQRPGVDIPEVAVVIPLYNYAQFILETLESVRAQTIGNLDLIVVDDCSSDGGENIVLKWLETHAARFRRACLLRPERNAGLAVTRNAGFRAAVTPFVFPLDADNIIYPTCLEKLLRSLHPASAAFAYCLLERFGPGLEPGQMPILHLQSWNPALLAKGNYIDAMTLLRKDAWESVGGYTTTMPHPGWEDYDLWLKLARAGEHGVQVLQILARYRVSQTSMLRTVTNSKERLAELQSYLTKTYPEMFREKA